MKRKRTDVNVVDGERSPQSCTLQAPTMFLRMTYWLNSTLTKSVNAGLYAWDHSDVYEPFVMLAGTNLDGKVFGLSHNQWSKLTSRMNDVSSCLINKQKKTLFVDADLAVSVKQMFGKQYVTLFGLTENVGKLLSIILTEQEWNVLVNQAVNISGYLGQLAGDKASTNQYICDKLKRTEVSDGDDDIAPYNRLAEEIKAYMRYT